MHIFLLTIQILQPGEMLCRIDCPQEYIFVPSSITEEECKQAREALNAGPLCDDRSAAAGGSSGAAAGGSSGKDLTQN